MRHVVVYREPGRFAGWPANHGIWSWGNEIVAGFTVGYLSTDGGFHARDKTRPFVLHQARSLDGGESWRVQPTPVPANGSPASCPGNADFTHPDFALMCARADTETGSISWFFLSTDRCHSWHGPYELPLFGTPGVAARTDYLVLGPKDALLFLTTAKVNGDEGRVLCARTTDGGRSFHFVSWIGPEPIGYAIMPASVLLPSGRLLVAIRCQEKRSDEPRGLNWIDLYASDDLGESWHLVGSPVPKVGWGGNPPTLNLLHDGRLCLTYGFRDRPSGIRARLSADSGATWGQEIILRADGGNQDLGYPRTVERPDGKLVTVYYFNDHPDSERYIGATVWQP